MKKLKTKVMISCLMTTLVMPGAFTGVEAQAKSVTVQAVESSRGGVQAVGWFTHNGRQYYRNRSGKLLKNGVYKISGSYYRFDKNGRMFTGVWRDRDGFTNTFSQNGKCRSRYISVIIKRVDKKGNLHVLPYKHPQKSCRKIFKCSVRGIRGKDVHGRVRPANEMMLRKGDILRLFTWDWKSPKAGECPKKVYKLQVVGHTDGTDDSPEMM